MSQHHTKLSKLSYEECTGIVINRSTFVIVSELVGLKRFPICVLLIFIYESNVPRHQSSRSLPMSHLNISGASRFNNKKGINRDIYLFWNSFVFPVRIHTQNAKPNVTMLIILDGWCSSLLIPKINVNLYTHRGPSTTHWSATVVSYFSGELLRLSLICLVTHLWICALLAARDEKSFDEQPARCWHVGRKFKWNLLLIFN